MGTRYAAKWAKVTATYKTESDALPKYMPTKSTTELPDTVKKAVAALEAAKLDLPKVVKAVDTKLAQAGGLQTLFKSIDRQKTFTGLTKAVEEMETGPLVGAATKRLDKITVDLESAFKLQVAAVNAAKQKADTAADAANKTAAASAKAAKKQAPTPIVIPPPVLAGFAAGTAAPANCKASLLSLCEEIRKYRDGLLKAAGTTQSVAFVKLLPPAELPTEIKKVFDTKALNRYVVEVEMALPKPVLDDLVAGVEGVSLATMQAIAETATKDYRKKALTDLEFIRINVAEFPTLQDTYDKALQKHTTDAANAAAKAVDAHWDKLAKASKAFEKIQVKAGATYVLGALSLAASVVTLVASFGTAVPAYISLVKSAASIASTLYSLAKSIEKTAEDVSERVADLCEELEDELEAGAKLQAREVLDTLGVPFMRGCKAALGSIELLQAKLHEVETEARELMAVVNAGLSQLEVAVAIPDKAKQDKIKLLQKDTTKALDAIGPLVQKGVRYQQLADDARKTVENLQVAKLLKFARVTRGIGLAQDAGTLVGVLSNLATLA